MQRAPGLVLLVLVGACARAAPAPVVAPAPACSGPQPTTVEPARAQRLHDLVFRLRAGEAEPWRELAATLHAFTLGRWECALGEARAGDVLDAQRVQEARIERVRHLACTHASGATLQTELTCTLSLASTDVEGAARALTLTLDTTGRVELACAPVVVERLSLREGARTLGALCSTPTGPALCPDTEAR